MSSQEPVLRLSLAATVAVLVVSSFTLIFAPHDSAHAQSAPRQSPKEIRLLFAGDILLSRQAAAQIHQTHQSPWLHLRELLRSADWSGGNLEGAAGAGSDCRSSAPRSNCFDINPSLLKLARSAGFMALGNENNHAGDLGAAGRESTRRALASAHLLPLTFEASPAFLRFGSLTVAVVSVTTVTNGEGIPAELPSLALEQKMRLARGLANFVVVSIHWGSELIDWPTDQQRRQAAWLIAHGADLIFGHHPHVIQKPECVAGKPVFFSLGNHVFDQKYPATKKGLIADCRIGEDSLRCGGLRTRTPDRSSFPEPDSVDLEAGQALAGCSVRFQPALSVSGYTLRPQPSSAQDSPGDIWIEGFANPEGSQRAWRTRPAPLLSLEAGRLEGAEKPPLVLAIERHASPIDSERDPRPYVYAIGPQGFVARWRGSALAWPLLDARLLPGSEGVLCALHRKDSFLVLSSESKGTRVAAYRWNGFGFDGVADEAVVSKCRALFPQEETVATQPTP